MHARVSALEAPSSSSPRASWRLSGTPAAQRGIAFAPRPHGVRPRRAQCARAARNGLLFELDGAVVDLHMDCHRAAFNAAFASIGYDCVNWTPAVYHDLLSRGDGTPHGLVQAYFELVGWPQMLATSEQQGFVSKVHAAKQAEMLKMLQGCSVPLRDHVVEVIQEALADGAAVAFISGTLSEMAESVVANTMAQLPPDCAARVRVCSSGVVPQGPGSTSASGASGASGTAGTSSSVDEEGGAAFDLSALRAAQQDAKRQQARAFSAALQAGAAAGEGRSSIGVDPTLLAASAKRSVSPEWLVALAATLDVPVSRCILLGASSSLIQAAATAGMTAIAIPRKMAHQGTFPGSTAKFGGYGPGECTLSRLMALLEKKSG